MEQTKVSPFKPALTYGAYYALITIVISVIIWAASLIETMGLFGSMFIGIVNLLIAVILLLVFTKAYRNNMLGGKITFGQAFVFGVLIVVFGSLINGVYTYIFNTYIDPEYIGRIMAMVQEKTYQMMANSGVPQDQIDAQMLKFDAKAAGTPLKAVQQALMSGIIGGSIMSLISSAIIKKNIGGEDAFEEAMEEVKTEE